MNELLPRRGSAAHAQQAHDALVALEATIPPNAAKAYKSLYDQKMAEPASEAQIRYVTDLIRKHDTTSNLSRPLGPIPADMDKALAHKTIEWLKARPLKPLPALEVVTVTPLPDLTRIASTTPTPPRVLTPGAYRDASGVTYAVTQKESKRWDGTTVKHLVTRRFISSIGKFSKELPINALPADAARLTVDEAAAFGKSTTYCCCCGRHLTNPVSVKEGIGPICSGRQ